MTDDFQRAVLLAAHQDEMAKLAEQDRHYGGTAFAAGMGGHVLGTLGALGAVHAARNAMKADEADKKNYRKVMGVARKKKLLVGNGISSGEAKAFLEKHYMQPTPENLKKVKDMLHGKGPAYVPGTRTILMGGSKSSAVLAHEMGHATGNKFLQHPGIRIGGQLAAVPLSMMGYYKAYQASGGKTPEEREQKLRSARNYAIGAGVAGPGVILAEEARATGRALQAGRRSGNAMRYAKTLAPAYASYAAKLGIPAAAVVGYLEHARRKAAAEKK